MLGELGKEYESLVCIAGAKLLELILALNPEFESRKFKWANEHRTRCRRVERSAGTCLLKEKDSLLLISLRIMGAGETQTWKGARGMGGRVGHLEISGGPMRGGS